MALPLIARIATKAIGWKVLKGGDKPSPSLGNAPIRISGKMMTSPSLKNKLEKATAKKVTAMMSYAKNEVKPLTPFDSGKARRNWKLIGRGKNLKLVNRVPYAQRLEQGWSKQRPNGMLTELIQKIHRKFK